MYSTLVVIDEKEFEPCFQYALQHAERHLGSEWLEDDSKRNLLSVADNIVTGKVAEVAVSKFFRCGFGLMSEVSFEDAKPDSCDLCFGSFGIEVKASILGKNLIVARSKAEYLRDKNRIPGAYILANVTALGKRATVKLVGYFYGDELFEGSPGVELVRKGERIPETNCCCKTDNLLVRDFMLRANWPMLYGSIAANSGVF